MGQTYSIMIADCNTNTLLAGNKLFRLVTLFWVIGINVSFSWAQNTHDLKDHGDKGFSGPQMYKSNIVKLDSTNKGEGRTPLKKIPAFKSNQYSHSQVPIQDAVSSLITEYEIDPKIAFIHIKSHVDQIGYTHHKYQLTYQGIPIENGIGWVHEKEGIVSSVNGKFIPILESRSVAVFSEQEALMRAVQGFGPLNDSILPVGDQVWVNRQVWKAPQAESMVLAWKFDLHDRYFEQSQRVYVDASSGEILGRIPLVMNCNPGTGNTTWYGGGKSIHTTQTNSGYVLRDDCGADFVYTLDWDSGVTPLEYTSSVNNWQSSSEKSAITAHWGLLRTKDYYAQAFSRNSWNDAGGGIAQYNQATFENNNNNATFFAYQDIGVIKYGRGDDAMSIQDDMNTLDIVAHEYTHGVTQSSSGLIYRGESGALNESFSDIFGSVVEFWLDGQGELGNASGDWLLGEDRLPASPARNMQSPKQRNHPDTYQGEYWIDPNTQVGMDAVHTNSGVQNYWFYLLSEGGNGQNDDLNSYNISGVGKSAAADIAYRTLTTKLTPGSQYADARQGSILAAEELFGNNSVEANTVAQAWDAVGVQADLTYTSGFSTPTLFGTAFGVRIEVENTGAVPSGGSNIKYYLESGGTQYLVGEKSISNLEPGEKREEYIQLNVINAPAPIPSGYYNISFQLDGDNQIQEKKEDNNYGIWSSPDFYVPPTQLPNLSFTEGQGKASCTASTITMEFVAKNTGNQPVGPWQMEFFLTTDPGFPNGGYSLGTASFPSILPGDSTYTIHTLPVGAQIPDGLYYPAFIMDINGLIVEFDEFDNQGYYPSFLYAKGSPNLRYRPNYSTPSIGVNNHVLNITSRIENIGSVSASGSTTRYYLSTNNTITSNDYEIGTTSTQALIAGDFFLQDETFNIPVLVPQLPNGIYYVGYMVDADNLVVEGTEADNVAVWPDWRFEYRTPEPNLTYSLDYANPIVTGNNLQVPIQIENIGTKIAGSSLLTVYVSEDQDFDASDYEVYSEVVPALLPQATHVTQMPSVNISQLFPNIPLGNYFIGFEIDVNEAVIELSETDNIGFWDFPLLSVGNPSTSISLETPQLSLTVSPNPARESVRLTVMPHYGGLAHIKLLNNLGQIVAKNSWILSPNQRNEKVFPLAGLSRGIYHLEVLTTRERGIVKLLIE